MLKGYSLEVTPDWIKKVSDRDLLASCVDDQKTTEVKASGKGVCYLYHETFRTSEDKNETHSLRFWGLSSPNLLQQASINEFFIKENEFINFHRVMVLRDGVLVDKYGGLDVRVLDSEEYSSIGSIHKTRKVHCVISDLRLGDVLLFEYTHIAEFGERNPVDKKYVGYAKLMPVSSLWFYKKYTFQIFQDRQETVSVTERYFRDKDGQLVKKEPILLSAKGTFSFERLNFQDEYGQDVLIPFLDIATCAEWSQISADMFTLFNSASSDVSIDNPKAFKSLDLDSGDIHIEEKIQRVIEFVQNQIVYLYDAEVMHGHIPRSVNETLELKSGDCKAKSLLLVKLLAAIGVESEFVLVNYQSDGLLSSYSPSPFLFNHIIVKVNHGGSFHFVDPTWSGRFGALGNRSEPIFSNYLRIPNGTALENKPLRSLSDFNIDETVDIKLKGKEGIIKINSLYRRESADSIRASLKVNSQSKIVALQNKEVLGLLQYAEQRDPEKAFTDASYTVISDDLKKNELVVCYEAILLNPYQYVDGLKVFKFFNYFDDSQIRNYNSKDILCNNFFTHSARQRLIISSDSFVSKRHNVTKKSLELDNQYFFFCNKKKLSTKRVEVLSELRFKQYGPIAEADLKELKWDYASIANSNYGVGIIYVNFWVYTRIFLLLAISVVSAGGHYLSNLQTRQVGLAPLVAIEQQNVPLKNKYVDPDFGFSFLYPEDWEIVVEDRNRLHSVFALASAAGIGKTALRGGVAVNSLMYSPKDGLDGMSQDFRQQVADEAQSTGDQWKVISEDRVTFLGVLANKYITTKLRTFDDGKTYVKQQSKIFQFFTDRGVAYGIEYKNDIDKYSRMEPLGDKVLDSLKFE